MIDEDYIKAITERVLKTQQVSSAPVKMRAELAYDLALVAAKGDKLSSQLAAEVADRVKAAIQALADGQ